MVVPDCAGVSCDIDRALNEKLQSKIEVEKGESEASPRVLIRMELAESKLIGLLTYVSAAHYVDE